MSKERDMLPQSGHFLLERLAEGIYSAMSIDGSGSMCNAGILDLGSYTLIFDTFWTLEAAQDLRNAAERLTGRAVSYVVNSHYNADHINGNQVFAPDVIIISTAGTRELIETRGTEFRAWARENLAATLDEEEAQLQNEPDATKRSRQALNLATSRALLNDLPALSLTLPNLTFERKLVLHSAKRTVELITLGGGHTPSDAFLYLPDERIAFLGDLLFTKMHPSMWHDKPGEWISILEQIEQLDITTVVPGHGPLGTREDVVLLRHYLAKVLELTAAVIERGGTAEDAAHEPIPALYDDWENPENFRDLMRSCYQILSSSSKEA